MKKEELKELLNKSAVSIYLHDSTLEKFSFINNDIEFTICIGEYHFLTNYLDDYVDDMEDYMVLTLKFSGIKDFKAELPGEFELNYSEIMDNDVIDNIFKIKFLESGVPGTLEFGFESFEWNILGEFDMESYKKFVKENGYR